MRGRGPSGYRAADMNTLITVDYVSIGTVDRPQGPSEQIIRIKKVQQACVWLETRRQARWWKPDRHHFRTGKCKKGNFVAESDEATQPIHPLKRRQALVRTLLAVADVVREGVSAERMGQCHQRHRAVLQRAVIQGSERVLDPFMNTPVGECFLAASASA